MPQALFGVFGTQDCLASRRPSRSAMIVAAGLVLLLASIGCGKKDDANDDDADLAAQKAIPVQTAAVEIANFADVTKVFGSLVPLKTVRIQVEIGGRIEKLTVKDGSRVRKGQVLARINARVMAAQVKQAQAGLDLQRVETARTEKLVAKKLAPPQQLDIARAQLMQAEATLELSQASLQKAVVRAPMAGVVVRLNAEEGEVAGMGQPLLTLVDISSVVVAADVPERDVALMKSGETVAVRVEAFPGRVFAGLIGYIDFIANPKTRTFLMKIGIDNAEDLLRPGMLASLELERQRFESVVVVPRDAVIDDVDGKTVFVAVGNKASQRPVVLGPSRGRFAVVKSGLSAGDALIVNGHRQVVDDQSIAISDGPPCCAAALAPPEAGTMGSLEGGRGNATLDRAALKNSEPALKNSVPPVKEATAPAAR